MIFFESVFGVTSSKYLEALGAGVGVLTFGWNFLLWALLLRDLFQNIFIKGMWEHADKLRIAIASIPSLVSSISNIVLTFRNPSLTFGMAMVVNIANITGNLMLSLNGILGSIKDIKGEEDLRSTVIKMLEELIEEIDSFDEAAADQLLSKFTDDADIILEVKSAESIHKLSINEDQHAPSKCKCVIL